MFIGIELAQENYITAKLDVAQLYIKWACFCLLNPAATGLVLYLLLHNEAIPAFLYAYFYIGHVLLSYIIYIILKLYVQFDNTYIKLGEEYLRDFLTGLYNMRGFKEVFSKAIYSAVRKNERLSFLMIDIDHFKNCNDTYGHLAGDEIFQQLATVLTEKIWYFDVVSRNGGEEFSIILPECSPSHAYEIAERIRQRVENNEFIVGQKRIIITISIGIASYQEHTGSMEELLELSDKALYDAKQTGRNKVVIYSKT